MVIYTLRFWEGQNGPYEVKGDALSLYRTTILFDTQSRPRVRYEVLTRDGTVADKREFMADVVDVGCDMIQKRLYVS